MKLQIHSCAGVLLVLAGSFVGGACTSVEINGPMGSSGTSSGSGSSSSGGSGGAAQDCADTCHRLETLGCTFGGTDCNMECADQIAGFPTECADQVAAYFACLAQHATTCDFPPMCMGQQAALEDCREMFGCAGGGTCFGGSGMGGETSCGCEDTCKGTQLATDCTTPAGSTITTCDCRVEGMSVGTCQQGDANLCGVEEGCCNAMFFKL